MKMKKWEREYQDYKQNPGKLEQEIKNLKDQMKNIDPNASSDKKEILGKMLDKKEKIKNNFSKVENVVEFRDKMIDKISKLKEYSKMHEENARMDGEEENFKQTKQEIEEQLAPLNMELDRLETRASTLEARLGNDGYKETEKYEMRKELQEIRGRLGVGGKINEIKSRMDPLNSKLVELDEKKEANNVKRKENIKNMLPLKRFSKEEADKKVFELSSKVSKCNIVASNLMAGKSWGAISLNLDKYDEKNMNKRYTSKEKISEKVDREEEKNKNEMVEPELEPEEDKKENYEEKIPVKPEVKHEEEVPINSETEYEEEKEEEPKDLEKQGWFRRFLNDHPKLAGFVEKAKQFFNPKDKEKEPEKEKSIQEFMQEKMEEAQKEPEKEKSIQEFMQEKMKEAQKESEKSIQDSHDNEFKKYIKEIAEKGEKQARKDRIAEKLQEQKEQKEQEDQER